MLGDVNAAVEAHEAALTATAADDPCHAIYVSNLGAALLVRFRHTGAQADLDAAIEADQSALK